MKKRFKTVSILCFVSIALMFILVGHASATPALQLHIEGAEYLGDTIIAGVSVTESWFTYDNPFTLVVAGSRQQKTDTLIDEVMLWIAVQEDDYDDNPGGTITVKDVDDNIVTPTGLAQLGQPADVKQPHGVYDAYYWGYHLPDLAIGVNGANEDVYNYDEDYTPADPGDPKKGDLQYYTIEYEDFFWVHMDLTGTVRGKKDQLTFAPFSHDADAAIPEPGTLLLLGLGLIGIAGFTRKKFKK